MKLPIRQRLSGNAMHKRIITLLAMTFGLSFSIPGRAESQNPDYRGITDPFGDPSSYEFADDEKDDKEFFHLGRYLMFGVDIGVGVFTGGLGTSVQPSAYIGGKLLYFFDRALAFEAAGHYANHLDQVRSAKTAGAGVDLELTMVPITGGFRYYFDTRGAPKAIAAANPYLAFGGGLYMRTVRELSNSGNITSDPGTTNNFGGYGGAGVEFAVYRRHVYFGVDFRYHFIFFQDADSTLGGAVAPGARSGGYFTSAATLSYNF